MMKTSLTLSLLAAFALGPTLALAESVDPQLLKGDKPSYPAAARASGVQGTVIVEALIDEKGRVYAADVVQSVNQKLDEATLAAISTWTFSPAMEDGQPTMKVVRIPVNFNLIDPVNDSVLRARDQAIASK